MVLKFSYYLNICLPHKVGLVLLLFFVFFTFSNIIYGKNISPLKYDDAEIITSTEINISNLSNEHLLQDGVLSTKAIVNSAMPKLKESRLGKILLNYYEKSFGGTEGWNKINSYKVVAELNSTNGIFTHKSIFKSSIGDIKIDIPKLDIHNNYNQILELLSRIKSNFLNQEIEKKNILFTRLKDYLGNKDIYTNFLFGNLNNLYINTGESISI